MTKKERRQKQLDNHYVALEAMGKLTGATMTGKRISCKLLAIDRKAHRSAEDYCNGVIDLEEWEKRSENYSREVAFVFGGKLPDGFFVNGDPRGYTLKIDDAKMRDVYADINLHRDFGGFGILAPEITGD